MKARKLPSVLLYGSIILTIIGFLSWLNLLQKDTSHSVYLHNVKEADHRRDMAPGRSSRMPLLTLFTCFRNEREHIHSLVIKNWASLRPYIQPVLYTTVGNGTLLDLARKYGWKILPVPGVNQYDTPFIQGMYLTAYSLYKSDFYAFANGDLLFSNQLINTLKAVKDFFGVSYKNASARPFIIGQRSNYIMNITVDKEIWKQELLQKLTTSLDATSSLDYFITCHNGFPWSRVPDMVIGREKYDWYLAVQARYHNLSTIDATATNHVVHLRGDKYNFTHKADKNIDNQYNIRLLWQFHPLDVPMKEGIVTAMEYYTSHSYSSESHTAQVMIHRRPKYKWSPFTPFFDKYSRVKSFPDKYVRKLNSIKLD